MITKGSISQSTLLGLNKLMAEAMEQASNALAQIVGKKVTVNHNQLALLEPKQEQINLLSKGNEFSALLLTELMGSVNGASFLLIDEFQEKAIGKMMSKAMSVDYEQASLEMKNGILLELDNILSAAFITKLANEMNIPVFGGVPSLLSKDHEQITNLVQSIEKQNNIVLTYQASMGTQEDEIAPLFLWVMEQNFIEHFEKL